MWYERYDQDAKNHPSFSAVSSNCWHNLDVIPLCQSHHDLEPSRSPSHVHRLESVDGSSESYLHNT